jgi:uncharacterized protein YdbL (DUF1318 family)
MKTITRSLSLLLALTVVACVTINIYFPAEEIRGAADKIVNEVWGEQIRTDKLTPQQQNPGSGFFQLFAPQPAYAAQDINVSTPAIRTIKEAIKSRADQLIGFLNSGNIGLSSDGLLKVRSADGLNLKQKGQINQLVNAENQDRLRLYQEIAAANDLPDKTTEIQTIFAESWRNQAQSGWYLEKSDGSWGQK